MEINYLLIAIIIILLICIIRGATKGMLRIIFGLVSWIFIICFVNYGSEFVSGYISTSTALPQTIQTNIDNHLHERYRVSEEEEAGSGEDAVMKIVPANIKNKVLESVQTSIDMTISLIATELALAAIKGFSTILCVVVGVLLIFILDKIIKAIGFVPGVKDVNRLLGIIAGLVEGLLIIWLLMFIADCFPTSSIGRFVRENAQSNQVIYWVYSNNVIERIIGI